MSTEPAQAAQAAPQRHVSFEEKMKEFDTVPLFMRDLPKQENTAFEALQSLVYDGPPDGTSHAF